MHPSSRWARAVGLPLLFALACAAVPACSSSTDAGGGGASSRHDHNAAAAIGTSAALHSPDCDTSSGRLKLSFVYRPPCVRPWNDGDDNGGATATGVTATSIKVLVYSLGGRGADAVAETKRDQQTSIDLFQHLYETWGRKVEVEYFVGTAQSPNDEVAQHADALAIAEKKPFIVLSPPPIVMRDLAARHIVTIGTGVPVDESVRLAPYEWGASRITDKAVAVDAATYVGRRLTGLPARWAGDPALTTKTRRFGLVYSSSWGSARTFARQLEELGGKLTDAESYVDLDRSTWDERARLAVTRMKSEGVTSVVLGTNVLFTTALVSAATSQDFFPEWILTGGALQDLNYFSQSNDQRQWAHAFGIGEFPINSAANGLVPPPLVSLYKWYYGTVPASQAAQGINMYALFTGIHLAGPHLTPLSFRDGLFAQPPSGGAASGAVMSEQYSWGRHGVFGYDDYNAGDDFTEIYWDLNAVGLDRTGRVATTKGAFRYLDGGKRTVADEWPKGEPKMFEPTGTVTGVEFKEYPPGDQPPSFPCDGCPSQHP
jgi:hypothetical protein